MRNIVKVAGGQQRGQGRGQGRGQEWRRIETEERVEV